MVKPLEEEEITKILEHVEALSQLFIGESETVIVNSLMNFMVKICMHFDIPPELIANEIVGCMAINCAIKTKQEIELMKGNGIKH